jgi:ABC-type lipopolysaccharide export system ATPase subunit
MSLASGVVGVIGGNGAGKTTLFRMIVGQVLLLHLPLQNMLDHFAVPA